MTGALAVCFAVGVFTLGIRARADAVPVITLRVCQGLVCVNVGPAVVFATTLPIVVGDYMVSVSGAPVESPAGSNLQTTSIHVA